MWSKSGVFFHGWRICGLQQRFYITFKRNLEIPLPGATVEADEKLSGHHCAGHSSPSPASIKPVYLSILHIKATQNALFEYKFHY